MNLFNLNTGEYFTPSVDTFNEFKRGRRSFLTIPWDDIKINIQEVERTFPIAYDLKRESGAINERFVIYEIAQFTKYVLVHKINGEIKQIQGAQSGLALLLRHVK